MDEVKAIRERIFQNRLSFKWLIYELSKMGVYTDKSEISSGFAGSRKGDKINKIIETSKVILDDYERTFIYTG